MVKNQNLKIAIVVSIILGLSILGYGYMGYKSRQDNLKLEQERLQIDIQKSEQLKLETEIEKQAERKLDACLLRVEASHWDRWELNCKSQGWNIKRDEDGEVESCTLDSDVARDLDRQKQDEKQNCLQRYQ